MGTQSIPSNGSVCPKSPLSPKGPHLYQIDKGDRNFKICSWCDTTAYRTDDDLTEGKV